MAKEFKVIRPIQHTISSIVGKNWEIIASELGKCTSPDQLHRIAVSLLIYCVCTCITCHLITCVCSLLKNIDIVYVDAVC